MRQGESMYVGYLLLHYFFQGIGISVLFIVANALFLSRFEIESLPLVFMCSAVVLSLLGKLNDSLSHRWPPPKMLMAIVIFVAITIFLFFIGALSFKVLWIPFAIYILYQVVNLQVDTEFWTLSSYIFDVRQAKRLYGLISVGDVPAKLLGSLMVFLLAPYLGGGSNLLIISTVAFLAGALILKLLFSKMKPSHFEHHSVEHVHRKPAGISFLSRFFQSELVMALSILYLTAAIVITFIEFSFLSGVEHKFHTLKELDQFFAIVFAISNGIIILCKLLFSGKAIERLGVRRSLLALPLFLILMCISMVIIDRIYQGEYIIMWFFTIMIVFSEIFKAVLYEPLFLALFQPLPADARHKAHSIISGIIDPLGLGISGLSLYIGILVYHNVNLYKINYILIVLIMIWIVLIFFAARKYMDALRTAINKRMIDSGELNLGDESSVKILKARLKSERPDEVIYASEILSKTHIPVFESAIPQLLSHPVMEVRLYTLNTMYALKLKTNSEILINIINADLSGEVCEAAIKLYCSQYEDIIDRIAQVLDNPNPVIRAAAIKGFLKSGDLEPMIIGGQQLLKMLESRNIEDLIIAIDIIGELGFRNYYKPVLELIHHENPEVQKAAINACGRIGNPKLIEPLVPYLDNKFLKKATLEALSQIGAPVFEYIKKPEFRENYETEAIKICSRIGGPQALEILFNDYFENAHAETLDEVLKAIDRNRSDVKKYNLYISGKLEKELQFSFHCLQIFEQVSTEAENNYLKSALEHEIENSKTRLFYLLSFLHDRNVIQKAKTAYGSPDKENRANALEYLENIIDRDLKMKLFPMLEDIPGDHKIELLSKLMEPDAHQSRQGIINSILREKNNPFLQWTKAITLYKFCLQFDEKIHGRYLISGNKLLSECAESANKTLLATNKKNQILTDMKEEKHHGHKGHSEKESMLEIEKILILKSANMFAATPENILVGIAGIAREERKRKGEDIFVKDDLGNCLYIICEGDISIHIDGKELSVLHSRDLFGELALLDPEPRSATATALNDCLLLRIDQLEFNELIEERPEVAQGILTILSRRIRSQNTLIGELQARK